MNSRPFSVKVSDWSPVISRNSPVKPYGYVVVTLTSHLNMRGCNIETLGLVSTIRLRGFPFISTEIIGVPCPNVTETGDFVTASPGAPRWKELSSFSPLIRFPDFSLLF